MLGLKIPLGDSTNPFGLGPEMLMMPNAVKWSTVIAFEAASECHVTSRRPKLGQKCMYFGHVFRSRILSILDRNGDILENTKNPFYLLAAAAAWESLQEENAPNLCRPKIDIFLKTFV